MLGETMITMKPIKALVSPDVAGSIWKENNAIADQANEPGKFTAFCSYEWTSTPNNRNLHRNVFFKDCAKVPELPFSSLESTNPEDLWDWMDGQRKAGNELLAISHNANLSDGHMFPIDVDEKGRPIDAAWAASRDRNERLTEIKQIKGQSETHPLLSPNDEFANYELFNYLLGDPQGQIPTIPGSFVRQAYKDGVAMQQARSYNPYKMGIVAGSDSHDTGVPYRQANFYRRARAERWRHQGTHGGTCLRGPRRAPRESCRRQRRLGRGKHPSVTVRGDAAQGDIRDQRAAHQAAFLRRLGLRQGPHRPAGLGEGRICERRADGGRSAGAEGESPDHSSCGR